MSIEQLQMAAKAAGYAMASMEDELSGDDAPVADRPATGNALVLLPATQKPAISAMDTLMAGSAWVRGFLPGMGPRATA